MWKKRHSDRNIERNSNREREAETEEKMVQQGDIKLQIIFIGENDRVYPI